MECAKVRKQLKEYANDEIHKQEDRLVIEKHVEGCAVCKRELLLWQEVMDKQRIVKKMQNKMPVELKDRIKHRMNKNQKEANLPPVVKRMKAMGGLFGSARGRMILLTMLIMATLVYILASSKIGKNIAPSLFILLGFAVLFFMMIFKKNKK